MRGILAALAIGFTAPVAALDFPQMPLYGRAFELPDPDLITWQITQRFATFSSLPRATEVFERYQFLPGETAEQWHARLWARDGAQFESPYAGPLRAVSPLSRFDLTLDDPSRDQLPWDHARQLHNPVVLDVLRNENNPNYLVEITMSYPNTRPCIWDVGDGLVLSTPDCSRPITWQTPITGATIGLRFEGALGGAVFRVDPDHKVIVGLGDSFGSGEGNPDLPAKWRDDYTPPTGQTTWLTHNDRLSLVHRARWLSERCHRSFFNAQSLTAFSLASQNPHQIVTFLNYA